MTDVLTLEQRHKNMQHIKCKDTSIELTLRHALWKAGYRYRVNYKALPGTPDIVFTKYKIAVFCDSEFFHGKEWEKLKNKLKNSHNSEFWIEKISKNIIRDRKNDALLEAKGWSVLHFWGKDILKDTDKCVEIIGKLILEKLTTNDI